MHLKLESGTIDYITEMHYYISHFLLRMTKNCDFRIRVLCCTYHTLWKCFAKKTKQKNLCLFSIKKIHNYLHNDMFVQLYLN